MCNIHRFCWSGELYEVNFHKPGIYGSGRAWANVCDVFRRAPCRGGRGCWVAVDLVADFGEGRFFRVFFGGGDFLPKHTAICNYEAALPHLPLLLEPGCVQGAIIEVVCLCSFRIRRFFGFRGLCEAAFHKPGIYGSGQVWSHV